MVIVEEGNGAEMWLIYGASLHMSTARHLIPHRQKGEEK
jgi:hypothetical protein